VADGRAEKAPIYSPRSDDVTGNREIDQDRAASEQKSRRFTKSNISSQKRSRHRRSKKSSLSSQGEIQDDICTLNASKAVRQSLVEQKRGITDNKETSMLSFIVDEARIDMKLDQLFETAQFKFGG